MIIQLKPNLFVDPDDVSAIKRTDDIERLTVVYYVTILLKNGVRIDYKAQGINGATKDATDLEISHIAKLVMNRGEDVT